MTCLLNLLLMMLLCAALLGHSEGVANIAKRARSLGASEAEITETLAVAFLMGGLPVINRAKQDGGHSRPGGREDQHSRPYQ